MKRLEIGDKAKILAPMSTMVNATIGGFASVVDILVGSNKPYEVEYETYYGSTWGYSDGSNLELIKEDPK